MKVVIITSPDEVRDEGVAIDRLLDSGLVERLHLRKPDLTEGETRRLIESIRPCHYPRISLHDHYPLIREYGLGGIHLNGRNPGIQTDETKCIVSRSCHSVAEAIQTLSVEGAHYCFLSPVFDSVSKQGYHGRITREDCQCLSDAGLLDERVFALSGIIPENLCDVKKIGFKAAAILGACWTAPSIDNFLERLKRYL